MLALLGSFPFWILGALIWPDATGWDATFVFAVGYALGVPFMWWLLHDRRRDD
jgi:hypothetical protein